MESGPELVYGTPPNQTSSGRKSVETLTIKLDAKGVGDELQSIIKPMEERIRALEVVLSNIEARADDLASKG